MSLESLTPQAEPPVLEIEDGVFGYHGIPLVGPFQLAIEVGKVVAVTGPSGCGKTTLLKTISGELPLIDGTIRLQGSPRERSWCIQHVVRTLQNFPLLHWQTVEGNLRLAARIRQVEGLDVDRVLSDFSALHLKNKYPGELSGGERCRASLAQAALARPKLLLLDEPFTGLDMQVKEDIAQQLFSFSKSHGTSIVFVTHDLAEALTQSDDIVVLGRHSSTEVRDAVDTKVPENIKQFARFAAQELVDYQTMLSSKERSPLHGL